MRSNTLSLLEWTSVVYIIRYREDVAQLRAELEREGFRVEICEGPYTSEQLTYSPSVQCLVNHAAAWAKIKASERPAIVIEPDFVPVREFGKQLAPMPFDPGYECVGMAWLYACGPIVYGADKYGFIHGHASSVAGCLITPKAASALLDFFARAMSRDTPGAYWPWDTELGVFLRRERHMYNYLPYYHLGEHGSDSRAEHRENGMKKNWHQADILAGRLAFLPKYANGSMQRFLRYRMRAHMWGWLRLLRLRYFHPRYYNHETAVSRLRLSAASLLRLLHIGKPAPAFRVVDKADAH